MFAPTAFSTRFICSDFDSKKNVLEMFFFFFYPVFIGVEFPTDTRKPLPCLFFFVKINNFFSKSFFFVSGSRSVEFVRPFRDEGLLFFFSGFFFQFYFFFQFASNESGMCYRRCPVPPVFRVIDV